LEQKGKVDHSLAWSKRVASPSILVYTHLGEH